MQVYKDEHTLKKTMRHILTLAILAISACASAQTFDYGTYSDGTNTIQYRVAQINDGQAGPSIMVTYLHGGSSVGEDNEKNLASFMETNILPYLQAHSVKALVFVPQCPAGRVWSESGQAQPMSATLKKAIAQTASEYGVTDNLFLMGGSAGGTGSWRMLSENPGYFKAALIAAGNPQGLDYEAIAKTPVYCVLSKADKVVKYASAYPEIAKIRQLPGADITLQVLSDASHAETCTGAYTDEALDKVFSYATLGVDDAIADNAATPVAVYDIHGRRMSAPAKGLNIIRYSDGTTRKVFLR